MDKEFGLFFFERLDIVDKDIMDVKLCVFESKVEGKKFCIFLFSVLIFDNLFFCVLDVILIGMYDV